MSRSMRTKSEAESFRAARTPTSSKHSNVSSIPDTVGFFKLEPSKSRRSSIGMSPSQNGEDNSGQYVGIRPSVAHTPSRISIMAPPLRRNPSLPYFEPSSITEYKRLKYMSNRDLHRRQSVMAPHMLGAKSGFYDKHCVFISVTGITVKLKLGQRRPVEAGSTSRLTWVGLRGRDRIPRYAASVSYFSFRMSEAALAGGPHGRRSMTYDVDNFITGEQKSKEVSEDVPPHQRKRSLDLQAKRLDEHFSSPNSMETLPVAGPRLSFVWNEMGFSLQPLSATPTSLYEVLMKGQVRKPRQKKGAATTIATDGTIKNKKGTSQMEGSKLSPERVKISTSKTEQKKKAGNDLEPKKSKTGKLKKRNQELPKSTASSDTDTTSVSVQKSFLTVPKFKRKNKQAVQKESEESTGGTTTPEEPRKQMEVSGVLVEQSPTKGPTLGAEVRTFTTDKRQKKATVSTDRDTGTGSSTEKTALATSTSDLINHPEILPDHKELSLGFSDHRFSGTKESPTRDISFAYQHAHTKTPSNIGPVYEPVPSSKIPSNHRMFTAVSPEQDVTTAARTEQNKYSAGSADKGITSSTPSTSQVVSEERPDLDIMADNSVSAELLESPSTPYHKDELKRVPSDYKSGIASRVPSDYKSVFPSRIPSDYQTAPPSRIPSDYQTAPPTRIQSDYEPVTTPRTPSDQWTGRSSDEKEICETSSTLTPALNQSRGATPSEQLTDRSSDEKMSSEGSSTLTTASKSSFSQDAMEVDREKGFYDCLSYEGPQPSVSTRTRRRFVPLVTGVLNRAANWIFSKVRRSKDDEEFHSVTEPSETHSSDGYHSPMDSSLGQTNNNSNSDIEAEVLMLQHDWWRLNAELEELRAQNRGLKSKWMQICESREVATERFSGKHWQVSGDSKGAESTFPSMSNENEKQFNNTNERDSSAHQKTPRTGASLFKDGSPMKEIGHCKISPKLQEENEKCEKRVSSLMTDLKQSGEGLVSFCTEYKKIEQHVYLIILCILSALLVRIYITNNSMF